MISLLYLEVFFSSLCSMLFSLSLFPSSSEKFHLFCRKTHPSTRGASCPLFLGTYFRWERRLHPNGHESPRSQTGLEARSPRFRSHKDAVSSSPIRNSGSRGKRERSLADGKEANKKRETSSGKGEIGRRI